MPSISHYIHILCHPNHLHPPYLSKGLHGPGAYSLVTAVLSAHLLFFSRKKCLLTTSLGRRRKITFSWEKRHTRWPWVGWYSDVSNLLTENVNHPIFRRYHFYPKGPFTWQKLFNSMHASFFSQDSIRDHTWFWSFYVTGSIRKSVRIFSFDPPANEYHWSWSIVKQKKIWHTGWTHLSC